MRLHSEVEAPKHRLIFPAVLTILKGPEAPCLPSGQTVISMKEPWVVITIGRETSLLLDISICFLVLLFNLGLLPAIVLQ